MSKQRADAKKLIADIADAYLAEIKKIRDYWEESGEKKTMYNGMERLIAAQPPEKRLAKVAEMKADAALKVTRMRSEWEKSETEYFQLHGEDLTPDANLLNDSLNPSIDQLVTIFKRYAGKNWTMESSIMQFASGKDRYKALSELPHTQTFEERKEIMELYDERIMRPMFNRTADTVNGAASAFDYEAGYPGYVEKFQAKILDL